MLRISTGGELNKSLVKENKYQSKDHVIFIDYYWSLENI